MFCQKRISQGWQQNRISKRGDLHLMNPTNFGDLHLMNPTNFFERLFKFIFIRQLIHKDKRINGK